MLNLLATLAPIVLNQGLQRLLQGRQDKKDRQLQASATLQQAMGRPTAQPAPQGGPGMAERLLADPGMRDIEKELFRRLFGLGGSLPTQGMSGQAGGMMGGLGGMMGGGMM